MLITEAYRMEQAALHAKGNYGTAALQYGQTVGALLKQTGAQSLLDYGCGSKRSLLQSLQLPESVVYEGYDPAIPEYATDPCPAELVTCIDVLEHIEPTLLDNVLSHLAELCDPYGFFTIHTGPAQKVLSDGRNAHLTQQGPDWWLPRLKQYFDVPLIQSIPSGFAILVRSKSSDLKLPLPSSLHLPLTGAAPVANKVTTREAVVSKAADAQQRAVLEHQGVRMVYQTPNDATAWRVKTLYDKEPDTIRWIEGMQPESVLLDVGANVGMYTIFAAMTKKMTVVAFEPESQNYALLNSNIAANGLSERVVAYPLALSDKLDVNRLFLSQFGIGGSCHSFGEEVGFDLKPRSSAFSQGSFSISIDELIERQFIPVPHYIKLDVDGFEHKVLNGAKKTLADKRVKEILVELNTHLPEHQAVIVFLQELGFIYDENQAQGALRKSGTFEGVGEFIFRRSEPEAKKKQSLDQQFLISIPSSSQSRAVLEHVIQRVNQTPVTTDPFPYLVVDNIFPPDYYKEILKNFPRQDSLIPIGQTGRVSKESYKERHVVLFTEEEFSRLSPAQNNFWRQLAGWMYSDLFLNLFVMKFFDSLEPRFKNILANEKNIAARGDALLVNDKTNYAIGPHTDAPHRLVTFLFYLPEDDSMKDLGTSVFKPKDPSFVCWGGPHHGFEGFDKVKTVEFLPNRLLAFPKTERSFHGVESILRENVNRPLLINNIRLLNKITH
jgi:FkbM family methyltransferase